MKGKRGGVCQAYRCEAVAWWWCPNTARYYCEDCARMLNRAAPNLPARYPVAQ